MEQIIMNSNSNLLSEDLDSLDNLSYSITIRTRGKNEKIIETLKCLSYQSLQPAEIVIVIPEDANEWNLEYFSKVAKFVKSKKGMISQRKQGILETRNEYLLLLDDDVLLKDFDAIKKLFLPVIRGETTCTIPFHPDMIFNGLRRYVYGVFGIAVPTHSRKLKYLPGGGYQYPATHNLSEPYEIEGGFGRCIAVNRQFLVEKQLYGDLSLEVSRYPVREDGAFIFSIVQNGGKALLVDAGLYEHLASQAATNPTRTFDSYESLIYNHFLFWKKYIRRRYRFQIVPIFGFACYLTGILFLSVFASLSKKSILPIKGAFSELLRLFGFLK
ncbi:MAG: glycosyltransferase [Caldisericum sp.]|uniref:glycosyltransferase n=1 Tax=Caldisericum sp. TaxID=2499687 RepID=UPI003D11745A